MHKSKIDMKSILLLGISVLLVTNVWAQQPRADLYQCEGCEAIFEHAFDNLSSSTTIQASAGEALTLSGTVYLPDGKTPASGVVIYAYHTDATGIYPKRGDEEGWARRHGYLRGWVKTGNDGRYEIKTIRPAQYPNRKEAAHIHLTLKEPAFPPYWIDSVVFEDDPLVTRAYQRRLQNRGGSGVIALKQTKKGGWTGTRDIILEHHPRSKTDTLRVETGQSIIKWEGTKFWGLRSHSGEVKIEAGELYVASGRIQGGWFEINMETIEVTDIPKSDPIPRKRLRDHLMNDDFFSVPRFPTSRFVITETHQKQQGWTIIAGDLTIRDQTHPVQFNAETPAVSAASVNAEASLTIDRRQWGVNFTGSRVTNDLVDDEIYLEIALQCVKG